MDAVEVRQGGLSLTVSIATGPRPDGVINATVMCYERDAGMGIDLTRDHAEAIRDALTQALEETKPLPSKAERIREEFDRLRYGPNDRIYKRIMAILDEDGDL